MEPKPADRPEEGQQTRVRTVRPDEAVPWDTPAQVQLRRAGARWSHREGSVFG
ncbi:MAG TPA: hypothetical protein VKP88_04840 [Candidatus Paceibacterota bacterium]|nr:hypothetical protein [Candidatus Paceibacterota bacterium]